MDHDSSVRLRALRETDLTKITSSTSLIPLYNYAGGVGARCAVRYVPVPGDPLTHSSSSTIQVSSSASHLGASF
jgi:hypothetical protein